MRKTVSKLNNRGLSLVELIVTILIMSMIMSMIVMFIMRSLDTYDIVNTDTILQTESQYAMSYIGDIALEAKECEYTTFTVGAQNYKVLCIKAVDNDTAALVRDDYYYIMVLEPDTQILRFCRVKDDVTTDVSGVKTKPVDSQVIWLPGTYNLDYATMLDSAHMNVLGNKRQLLAEYVTDIWAYVPLATEKDSLLQIKLTLLYDGKTYVTTKNAAGRNEDS